MRLSKYSGDNEEKIVDPKDQELMNEVLTAESLNCIAGMCDTSAENKNASDLKPEYKWESGVSKKGLKKKKSVSKKK